jgi:hypothetical protein
MLRAMRARFLSPALALAVLAALPARTALAQDTATAGALFDKGVADMQAGHFELGCPAIEESQRLDPRPGTLFTLAECDAKWGKVASAVARYQDYVGLVSRLPSDQQERHRTRVVASNAQITQLKPSVPTLALVLPPNAPPGTYVTRNGVTLQGAALGLALPVDPGEYVLVSHAPSGAEHQQTVSIALHDARRVTLELDATGSVPAAAPTASAPHTSAGDAPPSHVQPTAHSNTAAYLIGGVGLAGVAVGSVTGLMVLGKKSTVTGNCSGAECNSKGLSAADSAKTLATVSNIGFAVGIAGLATSAVLLLTAPKAEPASARARGSRWEPLLASSSSGAWLGVGHRF